MEKLSKLDLNQVVDVVSNWIYTTFGGQVAGPNLAYTLLVFGGTSLGAGISAYYNHQPWVGALIGLGVGAIASGVCCVIGAIAKYCN